MSILERPRLAFAGRITWDPIVTNNSSNFYDEKTCETALRPGETAEQFRESAIAAVGHGGGNWNPHGTHRSAFFETRVTTVSLPEQDTPTTDDRVVGQPVSFTGMLVDSEPYGSFSSQLFFNEMRFGIDGGASILAPRRTRMTARRINGGRNSGYGFTAGGASVMWQTTFDKADLIVDAHDSAVLAKFQEALSEDDVLGLTVRWNAYRTIYYNNEQMSDRAVADREYALLTKKLQVGGFQPNPAVSCLVGVVGLWRRGEPSSVGGDRFLIPPLASSVGSAYARIGEGRVSVDLQNSIPETGLELQKHDYGELDLVAKDPTTGDEIPLATLTPEDYGKTRYTAHGGIVDYPLPSGVDPSTLDSRDLLMRTSDGTELLVEQPLYACGESLNTYLTEGKSTTTEVRVLERGRRPEVLQTVHRVSVATPTERESFETSQDGVAHVSLTASSGGGISSFYLLVGDQPTPAKLNALTDPYCYVRSLPADDEIAALEPTWDNVYQNILINWHAMAPCMDNWLDLGDEAQVRRYASILRKLTDPGAFEDFRFMPVTRDMTAGERTLLWNWLDRGETTEAGSPWTLAREHRNLRQRLK